MIYYTNCFMYNLKKNTFQQVINPKHTFTLCQNKLEAKKQHHFEIMTWLSQSPDLSPIELVRDELNRKVRRE